MDPDHQKLNCSVPFCPSLKVLDFSLDNDYKPDKNDSFTHASIVKKNLPSAFTICTVLFLLRDDEGEKWHEARIYAHVGKMNILFNGISFVIGCWFYQSVLSKHKA